MGDSLGNIHTSMGLTIGPDQETFNGNTLYLSTQTFLWYSHGLILNKTELNRLFKT